MGIYNTILCIIKVVINLLIFILEHTLATVLPQVLSNTPTKCEVDRMNGSQDTSGRAEQGGYGEPLIWNFTLEIVFPCLQL